MSTAYTPPTFRSRIDGKLKRLNTFTKVAFGLSFTLFIYGILSRIIPINFFWEAFFVSWLALAIGFIAFLLDSIQHQKIEKKFFSLYKLVIGLVGLFLLTQAVLFFITSRTDAYHAIVKHVQQSAELKTELGNVTRIGVIPSGFAETSTDSKGKRGNANFKLILKGDRAYKTANFTVYKDYHTDWEVKIVE